MVFVRCTIAVFLYSLPAQPTVYRKSSRTAYEIFTIIIQISFNHFYDVHKIFSRGWVVQTNIKGKTLRSSHSQMFFKAAVLKNVDIFSKIYLCWSFFLIKFLVWRLQHRIFPVNIAKFLRTVFFIKHLLFIMVFQNFMWWYNSLKVLDAKLTFFTLC